MLFPRLSLNTKSLLLAALIALVFLGLYLIDLRFPERLSIALLIAAIVLIGLSMLLLRDIAVPLQAMRTTLQDLAQGHAVETIPGQGRGDEIGVIADAAAALRDSQLAATRIESALTGTTTNVMIADAENRIVYCNTAVIALLRNAASDIRKDLPHFDPDALVGAKIDIFHKNPAHQRGMLEKLTSTYRTRITVGGRRFELIASPVVNRQGARLGTVVEWADITEQLRLESEVIAAIAMASEKGFSERMDLAGKSGFLRQLGEAVNTLSDTCQGMTRDIAATMDAMARGDLSRRVEGNYPGIFGELRDGANETLEKLREVVSRITSSATQVRDASAEISAGSQDLAQRTEAQAAALEETAASMHEVTTTVRQNADNAQAASSLSKAARETAEKGGDVAQQAVAAVSRIEESARKIGDIVALIDEIAFQTNLLALNASVEAARAGEAGKGFAVVAQEVRALAGRSANASKDIKALISESNAQVKSGAGLVQQAGASLTEIVGAVKRVADIVAEIAMASSEQSRGLDEVNTAIGNMDEMTQRNGAMVEQTTASAQQMASLGQTLAEIVGYFRLK
ncbi:methyl-accepting chemotaxis protein [Ferrovibrio sp.]|uniref:methyl-accepting chemotaxis protein n=1 Tax=Ferrovibrio sp. TaxID=1917215 RepID=UPI003D0EC831